MTRTEKYRIAAIIAKSNKVVHEAIGLAVEAISEINNLSDEELKTLAPYIKRKSIDTTWADPEWNGRVWQEWEDLAERMQIVFDEY